MDSFLLLILSGLCLWFYCLNRTTLPLVPSLQPNDKPVITIFEMPLHNTGRQAFTYARLSGKYVSLGTTFMFDVCLWRFVYIHLLALCLSLGIHIHLHLGSHMFVFWHSHVYLQKFIYVHLYAFILSLGTFTCICLLEFTCLSKRIHACLTLDSHMLVNRISRKPRYMMTVSLHNYKQNVCENVSQTWDFVDPTMLRRIQINIT